MTLTNLVHTTETRASGRVQVITLAEFRDGLRNGADALFIFRGEEKRAEERAVNAVGEGEFCVAHLFEQICREGGDAQERGLQNVVPFVGGIAG